MSLEYEFGDWLRFRGYDVDNDENFISTPARVVNALNELVGEKEQVKVIAKGILEDASFQSVYTGVVLIKDVEVIGLCPHHLLVVRYNMVFAYMPNGRIVGISKIPRYLKEMGRMLLTQEDLTEECLDLFQKTLEPKGCMLVVSGQHSCMNSRGIKEDAVVRTHGIRGVFTDLAAREEVLHSLR